MSFRLLHIIGLLLFAGMTSGCSLFYPYLMINFPISYLDNDGLGLSPIGNFIRMNWRLVDNEVALKRGLADLIAERTPPNGLSREDAESLGMQCAPAPSTECAYLGEQSFRRDHFPRDDPYYRKTTIRNIEVRFSFMKPEELIVKERLHDVSKE
jgi:hypothetical protein